MPESRNTGFPDDAVEFVRKKIVKPAADALANAGKAVEETLTSGLVCLEGFPRSLQLDSYSCGLQSASMILRYYGVEHDLDRLARQVKLTDEGLDQHRLRALFKRHGLRPRRINKPTLAKIRKAIDAGNPVLVYMDDDHWAVVYGYSAEAVYVADPALNRSFLCRHTKAEFKRRWSSWAMAVER